MTFKENWLKVDETCPSCGQVTKRQRGLTKQNIKRLFSIKLNMTEVLITFMLIMVLLLGYVYLNETRTCREWVSNMVGSNEQQCKSNCDYECEIAAGRGIYNNSVAFPNVTFNITLTP